MAVPRVRVESKISVQGIQKVLHWCSTFSLATMPTSKQRLHLTLPHRTAVFLKKISMRDEVPQAAKALELLERALEAEEGVFKESFVKEVLRRSKNKKTVPFEDVVRELW
jgi:hypothetical protein